MRSSTDKVLLAIGIAGAVLAPLPAMIFAPQWQVLTQQFGFEMAPVTRFALAGYPYLWLLPLLVLAAWWWWPQADRRARVACLIGVLGVVFGWLLAVAALWWPFYRTALQLIG